MRSLMVSYRVKSNKTALIKGAIKEFVAAIAKRETGTLVYEVFQERDDPAAFVHFMTFKNATAEKFHRQTPPVKKFVSILYPNCVEKPRFIRLTKTYGTSRTAQ